MSVGRNGVMTIVGTALIDNPAGGAGGEDEHEYERSPQRHRESHLAPPRRSSINRPIAGGRSSVAIILPMPSDGATSRVHSSPASVSRAGPVDRASSTT